MACILRSTGGLERAVNHACIHMSVLPCTHHHIENHLILFCLQSMGQQP